MVLVSDMIPGKSLAAAIERLLEEDLAPQDKELSVQLFDATVDKEELLLAWGYLDSLHRAAYKYWSSRRVNE